MKTKQLCRVAGIAVLAFGLGILISFILPETVLAVLEALVIVLLGVVAVAGV